VYSSVYSTGLTREFWSALRDADRHPDVLSRDAPKCGPDEDGPPVVNALAILALELDRLLRRDLSRDAQVQEVSVEVGRLQKNSVADVSDIAFEAG
jgi:hypothetical protein